MKGIKKVVILDDAGWSEIEIEVEIGLDEAGWFEIPKEERSVEHL